MHAQYVITRSCRHGSGHAIWVPILLFFLILAFVILETLLAVHTVWAAA